MRPEYKISSTAMTLGAAILLSGGAANAQQPALLSPPTAVYYIDETRSSMSPQVWTLEISESSDAAFDSEVARFYAHLASSQYRLPREIEKLLDDHAWELFSRTP